MGSLFLDDVADLLSSGGTGTRGANLFTGVLPALAPDRVAWVTEPTGGMGPIHTMSAGPGNANIIGRPRFQVWFRGAPEGYQGARQDAQNAFNLVNGLRERLINGTRYLWMSAVQSEPFSLPPDADLRPLITFSVDVMKGPSTSTST